MQASELESHVASGGSILDRVLVPVDYSMDSHRAVGLALALQRTHGSIIRLFHAAESTGSDDWLGGIGSPAVGGDWVARATARLRRFIENVAPASAGRVEVGARVGEPLHTIRDEIDTWHPTLVIAAAEVHTRFVRSPGERLVHGTDVATLIIPTVREQERPYPG